MRPTCITTIAILVGVALYAGCDPTPPGARYMALPGDLPSMTFIPAVGDPESMPSVTNWVCLTPILSGQLDLLLDPMNDGVGKEKALQVADDTTWVDAMLACERATVVARAHGTISQDEIIRIPRIEEYRLLAHQKESKYALRNLGMVLLGTDKVICHEWAYGVVTNAEKDFSPCVQVNPSGETIRIMVHDNRSLNGQLSTFRLMISREQDVVVLNKFAALRDRLLLGTAIERRISYGAVLTVFECGKGAPARQSQEGAVVNPARPSIPSMDEPMP